MATLARSADGVVRRLHALRRWYDERKALAALAALSAMDDRLLHDIGVFRSELEWSVRNGRPAPMLREPSNDNRRGESLRQAA